MRSIVESITEELKKQGNEARDAINKDVFSAETNPEITAMGEAAENWAKELFKKDDATNISDLATREAFRRVQERAAQSRDRQPDRSNAKVQMGAQADVGVNSEVKGVTREEIKDTIKEIREQRQSSAENTQQRDKQQEKGVERE